MRLLSASAADRLTLAGHQLGWRAVRRMPERLAYALFDRVADVAVARGSAPSEFPSR